MGQIEKALPKLAMCNTALRPLIVGIRGTTGTNP
jgi:hypothetical protein